MHNNIIYLSIVIFLFNNSVQLMLDMMISHIIGIYCEKNNLFNAIKLETVLNKLFSFILKLWILFYLLSVKYILVTFFLLLFNF